MIPKSGNRFFGQDHAQTKKLIVTKKRPPGEIAAGGRPLEIMRG
jgi:hypothetical protein